MPTIKHNKKIIKIDIDDDDNTRDGLFTITNGDDTYDVGINYFLYKNKKIAVIKPNGGITSIDMDIDDVKIEDNVIYIINKGTFYKYNLETEKLITYNSLQ